MRILFLGPVGSPILHTVLDDGHEVHPTTDKIAASDVEALKPDWIISHGYRHILKQPVLDAVKGHALNCHIAHLPWNRGADPNFWSCYEGTPAGVTIHLIDAGVDTGDIIAQRRVEFADGDTLSSSYQKLQGTMTALFTATWPAIVANTYQRTPQPSGGSHHYVRDLDRVRHVLTDGWDTPLGVIRAAARERQVSVGAT